MGPRAGLDAMQYAKDLAPVENQSLAVQLVVPSYDG
jgi:hypothetical protein